MGDMAVTVGIFGAGKLAVERAEIQAIIEHTLADRLGDWQVLITGSQASQDWELRIVGPNGFERTYLLEECSGEQDPLAIGRVVAAIVATTVKR